MRKLILTILPLLFLFNFAHAQETPQGDAVSMQIRIYRWSFSNSMKIPDLETGKVSSASNYSGSRELWYQSAGEWNSINLSSGEKSKQIQYRGSRAMVFSTRSMGADGNPVYKEVSRVMLPANTSECFMLMFTQGNTAKFYPMNVSPTSLPKDKLAVMNMTVHPVAIAAGGDAKILKSGAFMVFAPKDRKDDFMDIKLAKFDKDMNKWREVYDNSVTIPQSKRCLLLIYDPYNSKSPRFTTQILTL